MPVEVKEIVIKTTIHSMNQQQRTETLTQYEMDQMKREVLDACKRLIDEHQKKSKYKR